MSTGRMEAFSDGVIAILITVMVLELPTPHGTTWAALHESLPVLLTYVLSFVYLGIYWNNHHHMLQATDGIVLLADALAYYALQTAIIRDQGEGSLLATAVGRDRKGKVSPLMYVLGIGLAFVSPWLAIAVYVAMALVWLVPDRRLERTIAARSGPPGAPGAPTGGVSP